MEVVRTILTGAGDVDDYDDAKKLKIAEAFAAEVDGVDADDISVSVVASSVRIIVDVPVPAAAEADDVAATLAPKFATADAAATFLADADVAVEAVEAPPFRSYVVVTPAPQSPPPPAEPDADLTEAAGLVGGVLIAVIVAPIVGVLLLIVCVVVIVVCCCCRDDEKKRNTPHTVERHRAYGKNAV